MNFLGLYPRKTLLMLHDGSILLFQTFCTQQFGWNIPFSQIKKIGVIPIFLGQDIQMQNGQVDLDEYVHVASRGLRWIQNLYYKRSQLMENRRVSWKMRCLSLGEVRMFANMIQR